MKKKTQLNKLVLLGLLTFSITSCMQQAATPITNAYETMIVGTTDRTVYSTYSASIQGKQDVDIYPQVSGLITDVCISEGAAVKKEQTLFIIDQIPYKAALEMALANVENAEASVATAQMTVDSKEELYKEGVVSNFDLTSARNTLRQQKAALAQARAELTNARNNLSYTEVKSPVDGTAGMILYRIGALVSSAIAEPLVSVSDNNEMYVYFSMTEKQMLSLARFRGREEVLLPLGTRGTARNFWAYILPAQNGSRRSSTNIHFLNFPIVFPLFFLILARCRQIKRQIYAEAESRANFICYAEA